MMASRPMVFPVVSGGGWLRGATGPGREERRDRDVRERKINRESQSEKNQWFLLRSKWLPKSAVLHD